MPDGSQITLVFVIVGCASLLHIASRILLWLTSSSVPERISCPVCAETSCAFSVVLAFFAGLAALPLAELVVVVRRAWTTRLTSIAQSKPRRPQSLPRLRA